MLFEGYVFNIEYVISTRNHRISMMRTLLLSLFLLSFFSSSACRCGYTSLSQEVRNNQYVFLGKVFHRQQNQFKVAVIKTWKGEPADTLELIQDGSSCEKWRPIYGDYYVFFINGNAVHDCSFTRPYRKAEYMEQLERELGRRAGIKEGLGPLVDSLEIDRKFMLETNLGMIDMRGKDVMFWVDDNKASYDRAMKLMYKSLDEPFFVIAKDTDIKGHTYDYILYFNHKEDRKTVRDASFKERKLGEIKRKIHKYKRRR